MEPPSFDGGNGMMERAAVEAMAALQWSRRLSTAETRHPCPGTASPQRRFNGAAVFRRRKLGFVIRIASNGEASMEPPSFDGGNADFAGRFRVTIVASMEPPSFDGGNYGNRWSR